jgi:hypothetical protein
MARIRLYSGSIFAEVDKIERGAFVVYYANQDAVDSQTSENMFVPQDAFEQFCFPEGNDLIEKYNPKAKIIICVYIMVTKDQVELKAEIIKPVMNEQINNFIKQNMVDKKHIDNIQQGMVTIYAVCKTNATKNMLNIK